MRIFGTLVLCATFMGCGSTNPGPGGTTGDTTGGTATTTTAGGGGLTTTTGSTAGASTSGAACSVSSAVATNSVVMTGDAFSPDCIKVILGDAVKWTNNDTVDHHVVGQSGGTATFDLGDQAPNADASYTFTALGSTDVRCTIHAGMTMTVFVTN